MATISVQIVPVTVRKGGPSASDLSRPRVAYLKDDDIKAIHRGNSIKGGCVIIRKSDRLKLELYETPIDLKTAIEGASGGSNYAADNIAAVTAAGSVLTASTAAQLSKYLNRVTAATVNSNDAVQLPAPSSGRNVVVVINAATCPLRVFPHTASAFIDGAASGVYEPLAVGQRKHFATPQLTTGGASAVWQTAIDNGNLS